MLGERDHTAIRIGDLVIGSRGGPIMKVASVIGAVAVCVWRVDHRVVESVVATNDLNRVAPSRLVPIWGYWGGHGKRHQ